MTHPRAHPGFTLVELILVLVIIGAMLAIVAPSLGRMRSRTRVDDAAKQLRSMVELARARAKADGRPTRLVIDTPEHECWIEHLEAGGFIRTPMSYGKKIELDGGIQITSEDAVVEETGVFTIRAEPDGRVERLHLLLTGHTGTARERERVVFARSVTEPYRIGAVDDASPYAQGGLYAPQ